jgi:hypothetical protein
MILIKQKSILYKHALTYSGKATYKKEFPFFYIWKRLYESKRKKYIILDECVGIGGLDKKREKKVID